MAVPIVVWTDHRRRLVMLMGESAEQNEYKLEYKAGSLDAMGKSSWQPQELTWDIFKSILRSVLAWAPVIPTPDELA